MAIFRDWIQFMKVNGIKDLAHKDVENISSEHGADVQEPQEMC